MTNEIKKLKEDIAILREKLNKLEEIEKQPKMTLENEGQFSLVCYDGYLYYRLEYTTDVIWYGRLEPIQDIKTKNELESQWLMNDVKYQNDDKPHYIDDPEYCSGIEWDEKDNPPEPTSTAFRQKIFDGIKSVFYDPDYERTHWKMKVNMAVDEVLTHFYDIIPEPQEPICDVFNKGWNSCLKSIKMRMEHTDD